MKPLLRLRHLRIAGFAVGAVAVAVAAVLVTASAAGFSVDFRPSSSSINAAANINQAATASAVCTDFISHLSGGLGKSQSQVNAAIQKAIGETLADQVKNKQLTQAQADALKQKLTAQPLCNLTAGMGRKPGPAARGQAGTYMQELLNAAASALGISATQLKADLAGGMSLSQIAAAHNPPVTETQFRTNLIAQITPLLDAGVKNQKLTSAQEQLILKRLQAGPIPYWNTPRRPKAVAPVAPASPAATTT
ncbi:MAG: hypothetical protein ACREOM_06605 [Candidatus Dormibacteraceae bacterium]